MSRARGGRRRARRANLISLAAYSPEQAQKYAEQMIGKKLITKQTGAAGRVCNAVSCSVRRAARRDEMLILCASNRSCLLSEETPLTSTTLRSSTTVVSVAQLSLPPVKVA